MCTIDDFQWFTYDYSVLPYKVMYMTMMTVYGQLQSTTREMYVYCFVARALVGVVALSKFSDVVPLVV